MDNLFGFMTPKVAGMTRRIVRNSRQRFTIGLWLVCYSGTWGNNKRATGVAEGDRDVTVRRGAASQVERRTIRALSRWLPSGVIV